MSRPSDKLDTSTKILKDGSLKPKTIDKLDAKQKTWSVNVMRALGLQSTNSQSRVLSEGIASAALVEARGSNTDKATARKLRATVVAAGKPPWKDAGKAMAATSAKVHLDILSLPTDERQLKPLSADKKGIHQAFWIDRRNPADDTDHAFLCKPANKPSANDLGSALADSGGPRGGEVAREALSGRGAQLLAAQTGIDIGMPETHVISLDAAMIPGSDPHGPPTVTCSVQEARAASGDLKSLHSIQKETMSADQVAGLAIFDTLTLNTDRHVGNVLVDAKGNAIPIDHGESFAEPNEDGINRIKATLGSPHNALLALPGAHAPMSNDMVKKLKALDPDKFASGLKKDNQMIGAEHPDMKDAVSQGAIDTSRRAAVFIKLAAKNAPPLSPAAMQVAMGNAADRLFGAGVDEKTFLKTAKEVIARIAPQVEAVRAVCTSSSVEYDTLVAQAGALGWTDVFSARSGAPDAARCADPLVLLTIIKKKIKAPTKFTDMQKTINEIMAAPKTEQLSPAEAMDTVGAARYETIQNLMGAMSRAHRSDLASRLIDIASRKPEDRLHSHLLLIGTATRFATEHQLERLATFKRVNRIDELVSEGLLANPTTLNTANLAATSLANADPLRAAADIDQCELNATNGQFLPDAAEAIAKKLRTLAQTLVISADDADLKSGLAAAKQLDPFLAKPFLVSLQDRNSRGEFNDTALRLAQAEFDELTTDFAFDGENQHVKAAREALQSRDPVKAQDSLYELRIAVGRGSVLPSATRLKLVVAALGVPQDHEGMIALQKAFDEGEAKAFEQQLLALKQLAKTGKFDDSAAAQVIQQRLDDLKQGFQLPEGAPDVLLAEILLRDGNERDLLGAEATVARLEARAKAGAYPVAG